MLKRRLIGGAWGAISVMPFLYFRAERGLVTGFCLRGGLKIAPEPCTLPNNQSLMGVVSPVEPKWGRKPHRRAHGIALCHVSGGWCLLWGCLDWMEEREVSLPSTSSGWGISRAKQRRGIRIWAQDSTPCPVRPCTCQDECVRTQIPLSSLQ